MCFYGSFSTSYPTPQSCPSEAIQDGLFLVCCQVFSFIHLLLHISLCLICLSIIWFTNLSFYSICLL